MTRSFAFRRDVARVAIAAGALLAGTATVGAAQMPAPTEVFLERPYFSPLSPLNKNLLFEGLPAAHYFIINTLGDPNWQKDGGWRFAWPVSELFVVRMTTDVSNPVRTPSYHIRPVYFQFVHLSRPTTYSTVFWLSDIATGWTHYSNGQDGCTYTGFVRDTTRSTRPCVIFNSALAAQRIANTIDGDFSTSYFPLTFNIRRARLFNPYSYVKWQWTAGAELQLHPYSSTIPGAPNRLQTEQFGQHEAQAWLEWECRPERKTGVLRIAGRYTTRFGGGVAQPLRQGSLEASYVFDQVNSLGVFARQHWGYDYYNINFQQTRPFFSFGLTWDLGRLDSLSSNQPQAGGPPMDMTVAVPGCSPLSFWKRQ